MVRKRTLRLLCAVCRSSDFFHRISRSEKYQSSEAATKQPLPYVNLGIQNRQVSTLTCHSLQNVGGGWFVPEADFDLDQTTFKCKLPILRASVAC